MHVRVNSSCDPAWAAWEGAPCVLESIREGFPEEGAFELARWGHPAESTAERAVAQRAGILPGLLTWKPLGWGELGAKDRPPSARGSARPCILPLRPSPVVIIWLQGSQPAAWFPGERRARTILA